MSQGIETRATGVLNQTPLELAMICLRGIGQVMFQEHAGTGLS